MLCCASSSTVGPPKTLSKKVGLTGMPESVKLTGAGLRVIPLAIFLNERFVPLAAAVALISLS